MGDDRAQLLVERLSHVLREELRGVATAHGLALAQLEVLRYLSVANRFSDTVSAMVEYLGATKGTLSQTVSALERKGLLERAPDPDDGRVHHCRITPAGAEVVQASHATSVGALDAETIDRLETILRDLVEARGGRAFGVCSTCLHHRITDRGRHCALIGVDLTGEDATRICREHVLEAT